MNHVFQYGITLNSHVFLKPTEKVRYWDYTRTEYLHELKRDMGLKIARFFCIAHQLSSKKVLRKNIKYHEKSLGKMLK